MQRPPKKLMDQVRDAMRIKPHSIRTERRLAQKGFEPGSHRLRARILSGH